MNPACGAAAVFAGERSSDVDRKAVAVAAAAATYFGKERGHCASVRLPVASNLTLCLPRFSFRKFAAIFIDKLSRQRKSLLAVNSLQPKVFGVKFSLRETGTIFFTKIRNFKPFKILKLLNLRFQEGGYFFN